MRSAGVSRFLFAATLVGIGLAGLIAGDFGAIWQPVSKTWPAREALVYTCALVSLGSGLGLLWRRTAAAAAGVLSVYLLLWLLVFKARFVLATPLSAVTWENCGETVAPMAAAWVLFAQSAPRSRPGVFGVAAGEPGLRLARALYGLAMIVFGLAHFAYAKLTASLVPGWLPWHMPWVYLTGSAYIAAGAAILSGQLPRLAATLSAVQIGLFTLLVWAPVVAVGGGRSEWNEAIVSWTLTVSAAVIAASYTGAPWFRLGDPRAAFPASSGRRGATVRG